MQEMYYYYYAAFSWRNTSEANKRTGPPRNCFLPFDHNPIVPPRTKPSNGTRNPDISAGKFMNGCYSMQRGRPVEECSGKRRVALRATVKLMQFLPFKRRNAHAPSGKHVAILAND